MMLRRPFPAPDADLQSAFARMMRIDLVSFIGKCFETLAPGTEYQPSWHVEAIAWHLEQVRSGAIRRLIIAMPPRSLKSISASVAFSAFMHGHDPTREIVCVSYALDLATKHHADYRTILRSEWYRQLFPVTQISTEKDTEGETRLTARGSRLATSIGAVLTGRGADLIIVDDPLKPADAMSEPKREAANEWFKSTLMSRLNDKRTDPIVIVTQRLHMNDLIGSLLEGEGSEEWTLLELPAIARRNRRIQIGQSRFHLFREGDVLHPDREPLHVLEELRRDLGSDAFNAQYLQEPAPPGGNMFRRNWIQRYDHTPSPEEGEILQSWDTASKTGPQNDWSVCTTWQVIEGCYYLLHVFRDKIDYPRLLRRARALGNRYKPRMILVEDTNIGTALAVELQSQGLRTKRITVAQGKEARAAVQAAKFEGGNVFLPKKALWLPEYESELFAFPGGRHDDQVDSTIQAFAYDMRSGRGGWRPIGGHH